MNASVQIPPALPYLDAPALVQESEATKFHWGDPEAGYTYDRFYTATPNLQIMAFRMPVGGWFRGSESFKPIYDAHETYFCLKGEYTFHCPQTGEVRVIREGDCIYFPPETWHHGYNFGSETCLILEALTPSTAEAVNEFPTKQPMLQEIKQIPDGVVGNFVPGQTDVPMRTAVVRKDRFIYELVGMRNRIRVGLACSTDQLTTAVVEMHAGQESDRMSHPGDMMIYVNRGMLNLKVWNTGDWFEAHERDVMFVPGGMEYSLHNIWDVAVHAVVSVAPQYR